MCTSTVMPSSLLSYPEVLRPSHEVVLFQQLYIYIYIFFFFVLSVCDLEWGLCTSGCELVRLVLCCCCCCWVLRDYLTSYVINLASDIEREKSDKFCSEALISAWGSFTCLKSTTRDPRLYFPSEERHTQDFYALKKSIYPEPRIQRRVW